MNGGQALVNVVPTGPGADLPILGTNQSSGEAFYPNNSKIDSCIKSAVCMRQV